MLNLEDDIKHRNYAHTHTPFPYGLEFQRLMICFGGFLLVFFFIFADHILDKPPPPPTLKNDATCLKTWYLLYKYCDFLPAKFVHWPIFLRTLIFVKDSAVCALLCKRTGALTVYHCTMRN